MSGGQHEASAMQEISRELSEAGYKLRDAIKGNTHRGWCVNVESMINPILEETGYRLVRVPK